MDLGPYQVESPLAQSPISSLYQGIHRESRSWVALLHIVPGAGAGSMGDRTLVARLRSQVNLLAQHRTPGIPLVLDIERLPDGSVYMLSETFSGTTLASLQKHQTRLPLMRVLDIGKQLARSLSLAHQHGIYHLNLTPDQILVKSDGTPPRDVTRVFGIGLASLLGLPHAGTWPAELLVYAAPELKVAEHGAADEIVLDRADVFSLGVILGQLLTGQPLGGSSGAMAELRAAAFPPSLIDLLLKMTASATSERPAMAQVVKQLEALHDNLLDEADVSTVPLSMVDLDPPTALATSAAPRPGMATQISDLRIGQLIGNFRVLRKVGQGGMGVVYEAEHQKIGRRAAIKLLHRSLTDNAEYAKRFLNEARAVNLIRHRCLVEIFEFGQLPDGTLFYIMEYLDGESLFQRITKRNAPFSDSEVLGLALQIARALDAAHQAGIVHRDLKPENIMLVPEPVTAGLDWVKVLDFGIAKVSAKKNGTLDPGRSAMDTHLGAVMGTPLYMAPEQHGQAEQVDGRADVFSLGVILYELLAGKQPFQSSSLSLLSSAPPPIAKLNPAVSPQLAALVQRMMIPAASERPTMAQVEKELVALKDRRPAVLSRRMVAAGLGVGALLIVALIFLIARSSGKPSSAELKRRATALLGSMLTDKDVPTRLRAVHAFGQSRDLDQREALEPLLRDKSQPPTVVAEVAHALGEIGAIDAQPLLLGLLNRQPPPAVQVEVAGTLTQFQHPRGLELLKQLLTEGDDDTKSKVALRLLERGDFTGAQLLWNGIEQGTLSDESRVRMLGRLALSGDARAQDLLGADLGHLPRGAARTYVAFSLARTGDDSGWTTLRQVATQNGPEQLLALRLLAALGEPMGREQFLKLAETRSQPDAVRELAIAGLADGNSEDALPALAAAMEDSSASVRLRAAAAGAILQITAGERAKLAEQSLSWASAALGSDSVTARELGVAALGQLDSERTIPPLAQALKDKEREIRKGAARALGRKNARAAVTALTDALADADPDVRTTSMQAIGQVVSVLKRKGDRDADKLVIAQLDHMASSSDESDRIVASGILLNLGDTSRRSTLQSGLTSKDSLVRRLAVELAEPDSQLFARALQDADRGVRFAAARRLAAQDSREGLNVLREVASAGDSDGLIAYGLLRKLGESVPQPPGLAGLLTSASLPTRSSIVDMLADMEPGDAQKLLQIALLDPSSVIRRQAVAVAADFYQKTGTPRFLQMVRRLLNDPDVIVRSRAMVANAELSALQPQAEKGSAKQTPASAASKDLSATTDLPIQLPPTAGVGSGSVLLEGEELIRVQIDKGAPIQISGKPVPVPAGRHRLRYVGGAQDIQVQVGQTLKVHIPVTLAEQYLQDSKDAFARKEFARAQEYLDRVRRLLLRGKASTALQAELAFQQALLFEKKGMLREALAEYNRCLSIPESQRRAAMNAALQATLKRLTGQVGRIQIFTGSASNCVMTREILSPPGEQIISLGKGVTRKVYSRTGSTTQVKACQ